MIRQLLGTGGRATKRDIFYQYVKWFTSQKELDDIVSLSEYRYQKYRSRCCRPEATFSVLKWLNLTVGRP